MSDELIERFRDSLALYGLMAFFAFWSFVASVLNEWNDTLVSGICLGVMAVLPLFLVCDVFSDWWSK